MAENILTAATIYGIIGSDGKNLDQEASLKWLTLDREREFGKALTEFFSREGERAIPGRIGAVWDGRWIFWHRP